jgi:hypothetical protein
MNEGFLLQVFGFIEFKKKGIILFSWPIQFK